MFQFSNCLFTQMSQLPNILPEWTELVIRNKKSHFRYQLADNSNAPVNHESMEYATKVGEGVSILPACKEHKANT